MHPLPAVPSAPAPYCSLLLLPLLPPPSSKAGVQQASVLCSHRNAEGSAVSVQAGSFLAFGDTKDDDVILLSGVDSMGPNPIIN